MGMEVSNRMGLYPDGFEEHSEGIHLATIGQSIARNFNVNLCMTAPAQRNSSTKVANNIFITALLIQFNSTQLNSTPGTIPDSNHDPDSTNILGIAVNLHSHSKFHVVPLAAQYISTSAVGFESDHNF